MLVTLKGDSEETLFDAGRAACTLPAVVRPASTLTMRVGVVENMRGGAAEKSREASGNTVPAAEVGRSGTAPPPLESCALHPVTSTLPSGCCPNHALLGGSSFII